MEITKQLNGGELTVRVSGRLDSQTTPELEEQLEGALEGLEKLTFDFEELDYISSAGLRVLLVCLKTMKKQGEMKLLHVNSEVMDILDVTGFSEILAIE